jgi:hypothetical protein
MIAFQNRRQFSVDEIQMRDDKTISTLLVPAPLVESLKLKLMNHENSMAVYFRNLLWMYRTFTHSGMLTPPRKIKTEYQEEGLQLKRVSFRVSNNDWLELGQLALAFGKSRCFVFTFLLELDLLGLWEMLSESGLIDAVPTTNKLHLRVRLILNRTLYYFARAYHVKV